MKRSSLELDCPETTSITKVAGTYDLEALKDLVAKAIKEDGKLFARFHGGLCFSYRIVDPEYEEPSAVPEDAGDFYPMQICVPIAFKNQILSSQSGQFEVGHFFSYTAPHSKRSEAGMIFVHRIEPDEPLLLRISELELSNEFLEEFEFDPSQNSPQSNTASTISAPLLSEALSKFSEQKHGGKFWTDRTQHDYKTVFDTFVEIVGDKPVSEINQGDIEGYVDLIRLIPTNRKKHREFKGSTVQMAIEKNKELGHNTLSQRSCQKYIERLTEPFEHFVQRGYCRYNFISATPGFKTRTRSPKEARHPFSANDLKTIFESKSALSMLSMKKHMPSRPWGLLLGLYTGARASEIFGLALSDVVLDADVPFISICERDESRRLKNEHSIRNIPIHPMLIELGFVEYIEMSLNAQKDIDLPMLFPDVKCSAVHGWARNTCRWYNEKFLVEIGVKVSSKKVFHSFRHTVADVFRKSDSVNRHKVSAYIGHADRGGPEWLSGAYGSDFNPEELLGICSQIRFDLDLVAFRNECLDKIYLQRMKA